MKSGLGPYFASSLPAPPNSPAYRDHQIVVFLLTGERILAAG